MLDYAKTKNIFVIISLFDGANGDISQRAIDLMWDDSKLQSYIDNCLKPMATALKNHPALLAWEIFNEAEGLVYNEESNSERCYDTNGLKGSGKYYFYLSSKQVILGAGWTYKYVPMYRILKMVNKCADAIKSIRGNEIMVTTSAWSEKSSQDRYNFNYYKDSCVTKAGGKTLGTIDFYQIHTYSSCQCGTGSWRDEQPMENTKAGYRMDKPLIIGEFSAACSARNSVSSMYKHFYEVSHNHRKMLLKCYVCRLISFSERL